MKIFLKILKWAVLSVSAFVFLILLAGVGFYYHFSKDLPKLDKIEDYQPPIMAEVFDDQEQKIGEFWTEARILTPIDKIPKQLINAFVASEDDRFFEHRGVDPYGIVRAFIRNIKAGHVVQGASTITQQVTKALLLTPERTYRRKIREAILANKIEKNLTKEQILYIYLNQIYFGNRAYGVAAAARNYFHKSLDQLNLAETAMIAGLAKAPSLFNPIVNPARAKKRMNYVLDRMVTENFISPTEVEQVKAYRMKAYKAGIDKDYNLKYAPYFVEHIRRHLQKKYGTQKLYTGGWKIYSTVNLDMYQTAQNAVINGLEKFSKKFGYRGPLDHLDSQEKIDQFLQKQHLRILQEKKDVDYYGDPELKQAKKQPTPLQTGETYQAVIVGKTPQGLRVRVGNNEGRIASSDWTWANRPAHKAKRWTPQVGDVVEVKLKTQTDPKNQTVTFAKAFKLYQTPQVESALFSYEPFTGAIKSIIGGKNYRQSEFNRATQALLQPGSSIKPLIYAAALDKGYRPSTVIMDSPVVYEESPGHYWKPRNYGGKYYGPTAFRHALVNSRNVVTVRILMDIGTHYAAGFMRKLGISTPIFKFYSLALGSNEVKLEELATAYGAFITGGIKPKTYFISKIIGPQGETIEEHEPQTAPFLINYAKTKESPQPIKAIYQEPSNFIKEADKQTKPDKNKNASRLEMGFNQALQQFVNSQTTEDNLLLTSYEKKALYGEYIPEGYVLSPKTAVTMVSILRDVVRAGTGARARALGKPAGGKTGTTNKATDAWFIGFTPTLVSGVWVGFDEERRTLGYGVTGGSTAAPIWLEYMKRATQYYPTKSFDIPKWVDLSVYEAPIEVVMGVGDAEAGEEGVGTGVSQPVSNGGSSAEFFVQDL